jgi:imidazolonepropionase-like amidohydrolase
MTRAALAVLAVLAATPALADTIAIRGGTVITLGPQGTLAGGTVLIRDGRIAAVGPDVDVPADARVIDAAGRYVIPGIIDAHSHTAIEENVNECTDVVTAEVRIADVLDPTDVNLYRQLAGGVTSANVLHGSCNPIGGQNAVIKMRWGKRPEDLLFEGAPRGIKLALGENPKRSNFRVPGITRYPATRMGVEVVLRDALRRAQDYRREWEDFDLRLRAAGGKSDRPVPPRRDLELDVLRDVLDGKVYVHAHCYRADEIVMLIRLAEEFGFKVRTFQHVLEGYKVAGEIARHGAGASTFADFWGYKVEAFDAIPYNAAIMAAHGVIVSINSDDDERARRLYWEAAKTVRYGGVSETEALKMVTLNPARQLGVDTRVGSIETGKDADLAIFSAHPFDPATRVDMTLVDGIVYFDRAKDDAKGPLTVAGGGR